MSPRKSLLRLVASTNIVHDYHIRFKLGRQAEGNDLGARTPPPPREPVQARKRMPLCRAGLRVRLKIGIVLPAGLAGVAGGVERLIVLAYLVMNVRARRATGATRMPYLVAALYALARLDCYSG